MSSIADAAPAKKLPYPRLQKPRPIRDGITWLRVFHGRVDRIEAPFYGVNVWRVRRKRLASSIAHLINLAAVGLNRSYGKIHYLESFDVDGRGDLATVVLIYDWFDLPKVIPGAPPIGVLPAHFRFMGSVESYNWNLIKELDADPAVYATMLTHRFHDDICKDA